MWERAPGSAARRRGRMDALGGRTAGVHSGRSCREIRPPEADVRDMNGFRGRRAPRRALNEVGSKIGAGPGRSTFTSIGGAVAGVLACQDPWWDPKRREPGTPRRRLNDMLVSVGNSRRRRVGAVALVCLVLGGCSDDPASVTPTTTGGSTPTTAPGTTPTDTGSPTTTVPSNTIPSRGPVPHFVDETGFDDHSVPSVVSVDELLALSRTGVGGQSVVKFVLPAFDLVDDAGRTSHEPT